jgi:dihydroorotate dehydrogenase
MYALVRPLLFALDPARAHALAMMALGPIEHVGALRALVKLGTPRDPRLEVRKMGLVFPSPVGLAAGLDKNAERAAALAALGFGHVELGTVTAEAQGPNPAPNLFRLPADHALVNRLGFPNEGAARVAARIAAKKASIGVPVGVSIGKSRSVAIEDALPDYVASFRAVKGVADFVVVNVSSPNTKDLRALQAVEIARPLFDALVAEARLSSEASEKGGELEGARLRAPSNMKASSTPVLVKIAPDLADDAIDALCDAANGAGLAGVVATNTTIARTGLATPAEAVERIGAGGLSGRPLAARALSVVKRARARLGAEACVIGVGGIDGTDSALAMLRAGADLVQIYTGFVYEGPMLPRTIARGLVARMDEERAATLAELATPRRAEREAAITAA